ncbi:glycosyltransferase family 2 protein [Flavobacterium sp. FBOR7N2.3]|uniref:Glycosyltransferase family 2 protein n=1 Tax=Flavobacterium magnesitis TaxID=3138077 RepID=A0ABV4TNF3_9FLAO
MLKTEQNKPLISIIIPVFNREKLLPETLDSIIAQSFIDWECILVDDSSTDGSYVVMKQYEEKDSRFRIFKRPVNLKKGANSCRNYGFLQTSGNYIKWFDSDDIMLSNHLEMAVTYLIDNHLDFVVTDTINFNNETRVIEGKPYNFDRDKAEISAMNFALNRIGWITNDFLGTRKIVEKISFNEKIITDGDEYNFFVRLLNQSCKGKFLNVVVTYRRIHNDTLTNQNNSKSLKFIYKILNIKYLTAKDLVVFDNKELVKWFLSGYMQYAFEIALLKQKVPYKKEAFKLIYLNFSCRKGLTFIIALFLAKYFNNGYNVMKYARS